MRYAVAVVLVALALAGGCWEPDEPGVVNDAPSAPFCREVTWSGCRLLWCERASGQAGFGGLAPLGPCNPGGER